MAPTSIAHATLDLLKLDLATAADEHDVAAFTQSLADAPPPQIRLVKRSDVNVRETSPFLSRDDAARHALTLANQISIRQNREYGGVIFEYQDATGNTRYGYTGPHNTGTETMLNQTALEGRVPPLARVVALYHTHGDYSIKQADGKIVATHNRNKDAFRSDSFSRDDLAMHIKLARRARAILAEFPDKDQYFKAKYGAPAISGLRFHLAGPGREFRVHDPNGAANPHSAARDPHTNKVIKGGGTDVPLPQVAYQPHADDDLISLV